MTDVVVVDLPGAAMRQIGARTGRNPAAITSSQPLDDLVDDETLVVVAAAASSGVAVAQAVHRLAPEVAVVLVADDVAEGNEMRATLTVTPGISRHLSCVPWAQPGPLDPTPAQVEPAPPAPPHPPTPPPPPP